MKQNITLSLEKDLLRQLKVLAARRSTSISRMLSDELREMVDRSRNYERCKKQAMTALAAGFHLGGRPARREDLHER
jgi:metal-responsive CopG/Arc/MetJ family transcriptional regulator